VGMSTWLVVFSGWTCPVACHWAL